MTTDLISQKQISLHRNNHFCIIDSDLGINTIFVKIIIIDALLIITGTVFSVVIHVQSQATCVSTLCFYYNKGHYITGVNMGTTLYDH